jgi:integrase
VSVRLTLSRLSAAFNQALDDGKVTRNPCARVRLPKMAASKKSSWSKDEARQFLTEAAGDRLHAAWLMALYGGRREEICGARWEQDIDLQARTWTVSDVRVLVDSKVIVKDAPKSERGARTLPLPEDLAAALTALHKRQAAEKLAAGPGLPRQRIRPRGRAWGAREPRVALGRVRPGGQARRGPAHHPARDSPHGQLADGEGRPRGQHPRRLVRAHAGGQQDHVRARTARGPGGRPGHARRDLQDRRELT